MTAARLVKRKPKPARRKERFPDGLGYVDGRVTPLAKAKVPLNDRGYLLGDGVFETLRTNGKHVFRLESHARRLTQGLKVVGLDAPVLEDFHAAVTKLVDAGFKAYKDDLYVRVNISTGPMADIAGEDRGILVTGSCKRFKPYPMQYYSKGIQLIIAKQRKDTANPLSTAKTLSFLPYVAARREAHSLTAHDALMLNEHGRVAEASTSNVFAVKGNKIYAPGPSEGALAGVTREVVLELVQEADLDLVESLTLAQLRGADEAFLTNTTGGIVPVTRLHDDPIGDGKRGEVTAHLSQGLEALLRNHVAK